MATVVDSLVVALGLDASGFTKGTKDASEALKKTSDNAERTAKELESRGKQAGQFFAQIKKEVIGLFAVFTAGKGIESFVSDVVASDAAVGRLAKNIGMSTESLSAWQGVAERAGGSASGIAGSLQNMAMQAEQFKLKGAASADTLEALARMHINPAQFLSQNTSQSDRMMELADSMGKMSAPDAQMWGKQLGLDEGTINVLMRGRQAVQALLAEQEKIGHTNDADAKSAAALQAAWRSLSQSSEDLGRKILTALSPAMQALGKVILQVSEWSARHRAIVEVAFGAIAAVVGAVAIALSALAASAAFGVIEGGFTAIGAAIGAFAGVVGPILGFIATALGAVSAPVLGIVAAVAAAVAGIAYLYKDWQSWISGGQSAFAGLWQFVSDTMNLVKTLFTGSADDIRSAWGKLGADLGADLSKFVDLCSSLWDKIKSGFETAWSDGVKGAKSLINDFINFIKGLGPALLAAFTQAFHSAFGWIEGRIKVFRDLLTGGHGGDTPAPSNAPSARAATHPAPAGTPAAAAPTPASPAAPAGDAAAASAPSRASVLVEAMQAAKGSEAKYGIPAAVTMAQFALESGNGAHMPAGSNNPFGIKAKAGQPYVEAMTNEFINGKMERVTQRFAKFDSLADAFNQHAKLLATGSAYASARAHEGDPKAFANALTGKYATDPQYGAKLNAIMARNNAGGGTTNNTKHDVQIAQVNVHTRATDANGIARDISGALQRQTYANNANTGLT